MSTVSLQRVAIGRDKSNRSSFPCPNYYFRNSRFYAFCVACLVPLSLLWGDMFLWINFLWQLLFLEKKICKNPLNVSSSIVNMALKTSAHKSYLIAMYCYHNPYTVPLPLCIYMYSIPCYQLANYALE
jgi:hypothetical protein